MIASTVGELIALLKKFDPNNNWYGADDGAIVIISKDHRETYIDSQFYESFDGPDEGDRFNE
jgi:hypothetical protein